MYVFDKIESFSTKILSCLLIKMDHVDEMLDWISSSLLNRTRQRRHFQKKRRLLLIELKYRERTPLYNIFVLFLCYFVEKILHFEVCINLFSKFYLEF